MPSPSPHSAPTSSRVGIIHVFMAAFLPAFLVGAAAMQPSDTPKQSVSVNNGHAAAPEAEYTEPNIETVHAFTCTVSCNPKNATQSNIALLEEYCAEQCDVDLGKVVAWRNTVEKQLHRAPADSSASSALAESSVSSSGSSATVVLSTSSSAVPAVDSGSILISKRPDNKVAMYLSPRNAGDDDKLNSTLQRTERVAGNAVIIDVKGGRVHFQSDGPMADEYGLVAPSYDLPAIVEDAHERGLYVIGRYLVAKDPSLAVRAPHTRIKNKYSNVGLGYVWVQPNHEDVLEFNREVLEDLVATGIDEINFDYIRYPTEYSQQSIGLTGDEKADQLMEFLHMARSIVDEQEADTVLGVSTFAILGWNYPINFEPLGQDIARFATVVDVVSPMAYPSTFSPGSYYRPGVDPVSRNYYLVYRTLQGYKELLGDEAWKLRPWLQAYYMSSADVQHEVQAVYDAGLCGFMFWSAQNYYDHVYAALEGMERPEHCR